MSRGLSSFLSNSRSTLAPDPCNRSTSPSRKTADVILDFNAEEGDKISIARERIPEVTEFEYTFQSVRGKKKVKNVARKDIDFIYDSQKCALFFNSNGIGRGFGSKSSGGTLLLFSSSPKIDASDIIIVE